MLLGKEWPCKAVIHVLVVVNPYTDRLEMGRQGWAQGDALVCSCRDRGPLGTEESTPECPKSSRSALRNVVEVDVIVAALLPMAKRWQRDFPHESTVLPTTQSTVLIISLSRINLPSLYRCEASNARSCGQWVSIRAEAQEGTCVFPSDLCIAFTAKDVPHDMQTSRHWSLAGLAFPNVDAGLKIRLREPKVIDKLTPFQTSTRVRIGH